MIPKVLVKGNLSFVLDGQTIVFPRKNISRFGVTALPWGTLQPLEHFGRVIQATVELMPANTLTFKTQAILIREATIQSSYLGVRFHMEPMLMKLLSAHIQTHGFPPSEYIRKYPRIPSSEAIQTFPLRVAATVRKTGKAIVPNDPIIFDVCDLSPAGGLLVTENQLALTLPTGALMDLVIEPRGWFPLSIKARVEIRRTIDDINPASRNITRYLGVKFVAMDKVNQAAYLDLLKDILLRIKAAAAKG